MVTRRQLQRPLLVGALVLLALLALARTPAGAPLAAPLARAQVAVLSSTFNAPPPRMLRADGVRDARRFAGRRAGVVAWAVIDSRGKLHGAHVDQAFESASVSKAMLLVATLRAASRRPLRADEQALLRPMITQSDNNAASAVYARVGGAGVSHVARLARMTHFREVGYWSDEQITPADQARLFWRLHRLLPARHARYGRSLLSSIVPYQRWGVPPAAKTKHMRVFFKGGWRSGLTHQVARLERGKQHVALAVMTSGAPSMVYSEATIEGIARRVLQRGRR